MILVDRDIKAMLGNNPSDFEGFKLESITNYGYDLTTKFFYTDGKEEVEEIDLQPGSSIFVSSVELLTIPEEMCARIVLKNGRIRQGLSLDAPVYQPGHKTRIYFRLTNVSSNIIELSNSQKYATMIFEQLTGIPDHPYDGNFSDEFSFTGMGKYQDVYERQLKKIEEKTDRLKDLEKTIYSNVSILLSIFIALFTLLATNVWGITKELALRNLLVIDFTLMGCISFLIALLAHSFDLKGNKARTLFCCAAVFLIIALFLFA